ncbi:MAG: hypothetical protein JXB10_01450 [Pirellulales bacterium]|nr:hypothetical protein [Pirellulales bacterium]
MLDAALLSHTKNLVFTVAPELRRDPLYIVDAATFDGLPSGHRDCLGWASGGIVTDYDFRERIGADWIKPGRIICLMQDAIVEEWGREGFRDGALNTVLHEAAHLLPVVDLPKDDCADLFDTPKIREWQRSKRVEAESLPEPGPGSPGNNHGSQFVRIATHLWARATLAGWNIPSSGLYGGACWFVSQPPHFVVALLSEIFGKRDAPFSEIVSSPTPKAFDELWQGCLNLYYNRFKETHEH